MKKNSYIGISLIVLVFGIIFIPRILDRIQTGTVIENNRLSDNVDGLRLDKDKVQMATLNKVPSYQFINQNNDTISSDYYFDKVYVLEFFFSTCPSICPIMNTNMLKVQEAFMNNDSFGIASITIDPAYDTAAILKEYAEGYGVSHPHWNFLTGDKTEILKLSNEGFKLYAAQSDEAEGGFEHSGLFALIDKNGFIRSRIDENGNPIIYYDGLEEDGIEMLIEDVKLLL